jgi:hypothetical protein
MRRVAWHTQKDQIPKCLDLRNGQKSQAFDRSSSSVQAIFFSLDTTTFGRQAEQYYLAEVCMFFMYLCLPMNRVSEKS